MDITNIPQNLIKGLEQKNTEQLAALSRVLNLVLGKTVQAEVTSTEPVTAEERQQLLKQTMAALAQINKQGANPANLTPAVKAEIARLVQQQNLIQSPELKWVSLTVNNRSLLTYTDKPVVVGQTLPIQLQTPQKLVLLDSPLPTTGKLPPILPATLQLPTIVTEKNAVIPSTTNIALNNFVRIANESAANLINKNVSADGTATGNPVTPNPRTAVVTPTTLLQDNVVNKNVLQNPPTNAGNDNQVLKQVVANNLRLLLPQKDTPAPLYSALNQWQQLPITHRQLLVSPGVEQALKSVAEQIRSPLQLAQPRILAQIIKNSGIFFESKLNHIASSNTALNTAGSVIANTYNRDLKGALLTLLNKVTQDISGDKKPLDTEETQKLMHQIGTLASTPGTVTANQFTNNKNDLSTNIGLLMQQLMGKPVKELSNKELRAQLLVLLQQHSVHSLAKIQLQQLHSVNQELETKDNAQPAASWQLEIPVKYHNEVQQFHVRIDREWVEDKNAHEENTSNKKIKQWSVTLRFDLPTLGEFCAQLAIAGTSVSATLWASQEKTFGQVRQQLEVLRGQLEGEGIQVKQLQCLRGMPPEKPMALSYSLIDIST